jgi:hypothetical protein
MKLKTMFSIFTFGAISLGLTGCYSVSSDAIFTVTGKIRDSNNRAVILVSSDNLDLCVDVSYTVSEKELTKDSSESSVCVDLVTDGEGNFLVRQRLDLKGRGDTIEIKSAKAFVKTIKNSNEYQTPARITKMNLSPAGGSIEVEVNVF